MNRKSRWIRTAARTYVSAAIRTGVYLSQVGEFAFVLLSAAAVAGLLSTEGHTLAMLVVAVSMIRIPLMVKTGDRLASRLEAMPASEEPARAADLDRHVVVIGGAFSPTSWAATLWSPASYWPERHRIPGDLAVYGHLLCG